VLYFSTLNTPFAFITYRLFSSIAVATHEEAVLDHPTQVAEPPNTQPNLSVSFFVVNEHYYSLYVVKLSNLQNNEKHMQNLNYLDLQHLQDN